MRISPPLVCRFYLHNRCRGGRRGSGALGGEVVAGRRDGDGHRGGQEGRDDREWEESWTVVAIGHGRGAGAVAHAIVKAAGSVTTIPGASIVSLKAVMVS